MESICKWEVKCGSFTSHLKNAFHRLFTKLTPEINQKDFGSVPLGTRGYLIAISISKVSSLTLMRVQSGYICGFEDLETG